MKYMFQFGIILAVTFVGEALKQTIPLPISASIYGLLIMLFCLKTKIIKLKQVNETASFLLQAMPLMFIPAAVGIIVVWNELSDIFWIVALLTFVTTVVVMVVTGKVAEVTLEMKRGKKNG